MTIISVDYYYYYIIIIVLIFIEFSFIYMYIIKGKIIAYLREIKCTLLIYLLMYNFPGVRPLLYLIYTYNIFLM